jgi:thiosulfate reductase cytochrome b subunit
MTDATMSTEEAREHYCKRDVMIYTRYERFWHWSQALLIFILFISGLAIHGTFATLDKFVTENLPSFFSHLVPPGNWLPFGLAVKIHTYAAITLILLWIFTTFWNFTTGQWKQYLFKKGLWSVIRFYVWGILRGEPHPYKKSLQRKQNALQSLAYLTFMVIVGPALWSTGIIYLLYNFWGDQFWAGNGLWIIASLHTAAAFIMAMFVIVHVYMTTTGKTVFHYIRTMITGYDNIELSEVEEAYLEQTKSVPMKKPENSKPNHSK